MYSLRLFCKISRSNTVAKPTESDVEFAEHLSLLVGDGDVVEKSEVVLEALVDGLRDGTLAKQQLI